MHLQSVKERRGAWRRGVPIELISLEDLKNQEMEICDPHNLNGIETGVNPKHYLTQFEPPPCKVEKSIWHCAVPVTDYRGLNVNIMIQITLRVNRGFISYAFFLFSNLKGVQMLIFTRKKA